MTPCPGCGRLEDGHLCFGCTRDLRHKLVLAIWLADELETTITRQACTSDPYRAGGRDSETPLVFDSVAAETAYILRETLEDWAIELDLKPGTGYPAQVLARYLIEKLMQLVRRPDIAQFMSEMKDAVELAFRAIDQPRRRVYCGTCCDIPLMAECEAQTVTCRICRTEHDVDVLRGDAQVISREVMVTASEAERYLGEVNGKQVKANTITKWAARGRITARAGYYRLGDILDKMR